MSALELRNRMLTLLQQRVNAIRSAARFVFRDHPDIARLVTSAYERRRRAQSRRAAQQEATGAGEAEAGTTSAEPATPPSQ